MPEMTSATLTAMEVAAPASLIPLTCPSKYSLSGPQVEPESSWWLQCLDNGKAAPRTVTFAKLDAKLNALGLRGPLHHFKTDEPTLRRELQELIILARARDESVALGRRPNGADDLEGLRLPLSMFLQLRPQPLGAVTNTARDGAFPVIATGRELARYFENETPGLSHQLALNYMAREEMWSPPRQAWIWAALNAAIYSALAAAWFLKWRGGPGIQFRPRPYECFPQLDVLHDRVVNSTNSADGPRRSIPLGTMPGPQPGQTTPPEALTPDMLSVNPSGSLPSPGTPRHPAYPSGHSTYSAAATRLLIEFFPRYREELCRLADNIGLARLWAGIHWRSDHTYGQQVGTAVGEMIIGQMRRSGIPRFPGMAPVTPPDPPVNSCGPNNWIAPALAQPPPCCPTPAESGCGAPTPGAGATAKALRSQAKRAAPARRPFTPPKKQASSKRR